MPLTELTTPATFSRPHSPSKKGSDNEFQKHRHDVRPGLSGLAQINGRNAITWEKKFEYDVEYTKNITFLGDWKIILLTFKKAFFREGINAKNEVTMPAFTGSKVG